MNIASVIKALRIESGLTQTELSAKLNIAQATIACYENGQREPHILSLIAYADYFGCSVDFIVGRSDEYGNKTYSETTRKMTEILTDDEIDFINKYRTLSDKQKMLLQGYIDGLKNV
ncbi:MAG: helix-turn-helix domain-containing protein [Clostridiales bacterium]|nr:helix-turn-helix domain-containing protein [Clostridiales bacterium]